MTRKIKPKNPTSTTASLPGDVGGRGRHPVDTTGDMFGDSHWPQPQPHEKGNHVSTTTLYMVIDVTTLDRTHIVTITGLQEAAAVGKILAHEGRKCIAPPLSGRGVAALTHEQLQSLYWNHTQTPPQEDYQELGRAVLALANTLPVETRTLRELEAAVARLVPADTTGEATEWGEGGETKPQKIKQPKAPRAPKGPPRKKGEAPPATSTTGRVWVIAEAEVKKHKPTFDMTDKSAEGWKPLRAAIVAACVADGINESTAATQYGRWKAARIAA